MSDPQFLRLKDGRLIDTATGKAAVDTGINRAFTVRDNKPNGRKAALENTTRRYLDDLPVPPFQSKAVAVVASYMLFGLSEADIAHLLQTDIEQINAVIASPAFDSFVDAILQNVREHDLDKVRKRINDSALTAANKVNELLDSSDEKVALAASKDILDRAADGAYSAAPSIKRDDSFTIRVIDERDNPSIGIKVEVNV